MGIVFDIQRCLLPRWPWNPHNGFSQGLQSPLCLVSQSGVVYSSAAAEIHRPELHRLREVPEVCPNGVHSLADGVHHVDFLKCLACGR